MCLNEKIHLLLLLLLVLLLVLLLLLLLIQSPLSLKLASNQLYGHDCA